MEHSGQIKRQLGLLDATPQLLAAILPGAMLSQKNMPNSPKRLRVGLTDMPEITEIRSLAKW
jgi:hypothetical protein